MGEVEAVQFVYMYYIFLSNRRMWVYKPDFIWNLFDSVDLVDLQGEEGWGGPLHCYPE